MGKGTDAAGITAVPPPTRYLFIWTVHKSDGLKEVGEHIKQKGVNDHEIIKSSNDNARLNSFKLTISVDDMNKVKDTLSWPKGWNVRKRYLKTMIESIWGKDAVTLN